MMGANIFFFFSSFFSVLINDPSAGSWRLQREQIQTPATARLWSDWIPSLCAAREKEQQKQYALVHELVFALPQKKTQGLPKVLLPFLFSMGLHS